MAFQKEIQPLDARIIEDLAVYLKGLNGPAVQPVIINRKI